MVNRQGLMYEGPILGPILSFGHPQCGWFLYVIYGGFVVFYEKI